MLEVNILTNFAHAPKKEILADLNIAFAKAEVEEVSSHFTDDIVWEMVGDRTVKGIAEVRALLEEMADYKAQRLDIHQIITHGKDASVRGEMRFKTDHIVFADFYEFSSAGSKKIKRLVSYAISLKANEK